MHLEIFEPKQRDALRRLGPIVTEERFSLGGGAAVGLYMGHRKTIDLDFFTRERFTDPGRLSERLVAARLGFETREMADGTLHGAIDRVKVSFLRQEGRELASPVEIPGMHATACRFLTLQRRRC